MARVNAGLDISVFADIVLFARALNTHGTEEQKQKYLVPVLRGEKIGSMAITEPKGGSDALSARTHARKDGGDYIINGSKTFITNAPIADFILVIARTSGEARRIDGGTWFIVERGTPGLETGQPLQKMGMKSSPTGEVFLTDVRVPASQVLGEPERGFHYLMESLDVERVLEGASTIGIAQGCLDAAAAYVQEREVFGRKIGEYQLIQEKIATMAVGIEMSRTMLYRLLHAVGRGEKVTREAAILKLYSSQMAVQASNDAVQIFGGYGYMEEYPVARLYRDAKHHEIGAGTTEIMKIIIARETLKAWNSR
jgi:alkylation response protein AidB-like acyl-CoA dehydrogenase